MAEKRMACWNCPRYERDARRCRDGKTNPKRKSDSVEVAELLGLRMLCHYNPFRDGLALRRHFPAHPAAITRTRKSKRPVGRPIIEIEIEEIPPESGD